MVDVYSFGVVLFELVSGKPAIVKGSSSEDLFATSDTTTTAHEKGEARALVAIVRVACTLLTLIYISQLMSAVVDDEIHTLAVYVDFKCPIRDFLSSWLLSDLGVVCCSPV